MQIILEVTEEEANMLFDMVTGNTEAYEDYVVWLSGVAAQLSTQMPEREDEE